MNGLLTTTVLNTKISEVENKIPNHDKYFTTTELNKLIVENFTARIKQANLVTKSDFDKNLTSVNRKITSNNTKYLQVQKKLNSIITTDCIFLGRMYFTSNNGSQKTYICQPKLYLLELKKDRGTDYVLSWKSNGIYNSKLKLL